MEISATTYLTTHFREAKMKPKKPKPTEPSARDKLSASFLTAFQNDFEINGIEAIKKLREENPAKYAEIGSRLIAATEPKPEGLESAKDMRDVAVALLKRVGFNDPDDDSIQQAIEANDQFINALQAIRAAAEGAMQ